MRIVYLPKNRCWNVVWLLLLLTITSCNLLESSPYDARVTGDTGINARNVARIEKALDGKSSFRFAFISDTQRWYDETEAFVAHLNSRDDVDFVLHGGDVSDFGVTEEFLWQRDILNELKVPYVVLLGNHDVLGNGVQVYRRVFGEENFSFMAGDVKFICLNTNALEFDYSNPIPDFSFIKAQLKDDNPAYRRTIYAMHVAPGDEQFNNNVADVFHLYVKLSPGILCGLYGHGHTFAEADKFGDGIIYYETPCIGKRFYLMFTINAEGYSYEPVYF